MKKKIIPYQEGEYVIFNYNEGSSEFDYLVGNVFRVKRVEFDENDVPLYYMHDSHLTFKHEELKKVR